MRAALLCGLKFILYGFEQVSMFRMNTDGL
jgi:hypothetical protein